MSAHRKRIEPIAWVSGIVLGAVVGVLLSAWASPPFGIAAGVVVGLVIALSMRRGRGSRGWSDVHGESTLGEADSSDTIRRPVVKGTPSSADLPVMPGLNSGGGSASGGS